MASLSFLEPFPESLSRCLKLKNCLLRTSLAVQWLRLHISSAEGVDSIPSQEAKILHAMWYGQKKKAFYKSCLPHSLKVIAQSKEERIIIMRKPGG